MQLPRIAPLALPTKLTLRFWGTRGSIPVSGAGYMRYGGNTSCLSLTSDSGHLFIFDCGSGARLLGNYLLSPEWQEFNCTHTGSSDTSAYILLSHTHWDHIQGFPFFAPAFKSENHFHFIGGDDCSQTLTLNDIMGGQMQQCYFPVALDALPSQIDFFALATTEKMQLDGAILTNKLLNHPIPTSAYRLELAGKVFVYATDHEPLALPNFQPHVLLDGDVVDIKLLELAAGADIMVHDAQYSTAELPQKIGWGHNSAEVAVDTAIKAGVKRLVLYHHDPGHDDAALDKILGDARKRAVALDNSQLEIISASDGLTLEL